MIYLDKDNKAWVLNFLWAYIFSVLVQARPHFRKSDESSFDKEKKKPEIDMWQYVF